MFPHLNLIENDHSTRISRALHQLAHPINVCGVNATFSLNWFHDYRARIFSDEILQAFGPIQFTYTYARHKGAEWILVFAG